MTENFTWDLEADVVVLGSGGAALTAAISAPLALAGQAQQLAIDRHARLMIDGVQRNRVIIVPLRKGIGAQI